MSIKIVFILANSADPDKMSPCAAFHLGLLCLPKYLFTCIQNEKGKSLGQGLQNFSECIHRFRLVTFLWVKFNCAYFLIHLL